MVELRKGQTSENIIVTLNELKTLNEPYYLFVFTQVTTKQVVSFIKSTSDDLSEYPERYNEFEIDTQDLFGTAQPGQWHYEIYEQVSSTNTDVENTTSLLEYGAMILSAAAEFEFTQYNNAVTYKAYNG